MENYTGNEYMKTHMYALHQPKTGFFICRRYHFESLSFSTSVSSVVTFSSLHLFFKIKESQESHSTVMEPRDEAIARGRLGFIFFIN